MPCIKIYDKSMQPALETCFKACVCTLGWEYQPEDRHSDIVNIEDIYLRHGSFWCLFRGEELIGMVAVRCFENDNSVAELKRLYVLPDYQGKGYGGMLFKHALDYAKKQGFKTVRADTRQDRAASLHLISKHRFRQIERYNNNAFAELFYELDLTEGEADED